MQPPREDDTLFLPAASQRTGTSSALEIVTGFAHSLVGMHRRHDPGGAAGSADLVEEFVVGFERVGDRSRAFYRAEIVEEPLRAREP